MNYVVEVRYTGADWPDLLADMRSWLGRRQIAAEEFNYSTPGRGVAVCVGFGDEDQAAAFASAFSGRLERPAGDRTADPVRDTIARTAGEAASISDVLTTLVGPLTESVSLMITRRQKTDLRERGYTDEQIRNMKPEDAHRALGLIN